MKQKQKTNNMMLVLPTSGIKINVRQHNPSVGVGFCFVCAAGMEINTKMKI